MALCQYTHRWRLVQTLLFVGVIRLLLEKGAVVGADALFRVPNDAGIVRLLLEHGADVNREDDNGRTPLHW